MSTDEQLGQDMYYVLSYFGKSLTLEPNIYSVSRIWADLDQWIDDLLMGY